MPIDKPKAVAIGRGGYTHMTTRPSGFAAMRSALSSCALVTDQPCFIYALGNDVMVGVPETVRVVDVLVRDDLPGANEADLHRLATTYLPDADWRAIAIGTNGKLGIALGQAGERQAIDKALRECDAAGGLGCTLRAVGPFKVAPR
jgi:hypothetical protein